MKQLGGLVALAAFGLAACGGGEVTVQASQERADGSTTALPDLLVRALPYDRDAIFNELEQAYGKPQPTIPDSLKAMRDEIAQANTEWSNAEAIWGAARDSLKSLSEEMQGMDRASAQYALAYRAFTAQETVVQRTEEVSKRAYQRFTERQQRYIQQVGRLRLARARWEDAAFAGVDSAIRARVQESGLEEYADTTDANGVATFSGMKQGDYWIHARFEGPFTELYWNVPVQVGRDPVTVQLNKQTAQERPKL